MLWRAALRIAATVTLVVLFGVIVWVLFLRDLQPNKRGIHLLLDDGRNTWDDEIWYDHLQYGYQFVGSGGYVVELIRSDDLDVDRWQYFMELCGSLRMNVVLRLATTFDSKNQWWNAPTPDADGSYETIAAEYAAFVSALDWATDSHYIIVGNEPNHGNEWSGRPDPAAYARFLIDVADAIHAADPQAIILNAGFDPYTPNTGSQPFADGMYYIDEETFLDEMIAAYRDVFDHIDLWASHSYPQGPFALPTWVQAYGRDMLNDATNPQHSEPPAGVYNRGINGYEWELWKLSTYGVNELSVMITETGWRHSESNDVNALDNAPQPLPDVNTAAQYVDLAFYGNNGRYPQYPADGWTAWADDSRVIGVVMFALNGVPSEWGHTNWLRLDADGRVLDTYAIFDLLGD